MTTRQTRRQPPTKHTSATEFRQSSFDHNIIIFVIHTQNTGIYMQSGGRPPLEETYLLGPPPDKYATRTLSTPCKLDILKILVIYCAFSGHSSGMFSFPQAHKSSDRKIINKTFFDDLFYFFRFPISALLRAAASN